MTDDWRARLYESYSSTQAVALPRADMQKLLKMRAPSIHNIIGRYIPLNHDNLIVDLGCGYGAILHYLTEAGYKNTIGVDVSLEQVKLAHALGLTQVRHGSIDGFLDAQPNDSVDAILMIDVIEHFSRQQLIDVLDEVIRVLKPGGRCIVHAPNAEGVFGMRVRYGDLTHELAFTPQSLKQLFLIVGFESVWVHEDKPIFHSMFSLLRRVIWEIGTLPVRLLLGAETGTLRGLVLTQNMIAVAERSSPDDVA